MDDRAQPVELQLAEFVPVVYNNAGRVTGVNGTNPVNPYASSIEYKAIGAQEDAIGARVVGAVGLQSETRAGSADAGGGPRRRRKRWERWNFRIARELGMRRSVRPTMETWRPR